MILLYIGVGTMGAPARDRCPPTFSDGMISEYKIEPSYATDSYIARLNFIHTDHTALAYRCIEPPFTKPSSYQESSEGAREEEQRAEVGNGWKDGNLVEGRVSRKAREE